MLGGIFFQMGESNPVKFQPMLNFTLVTITAYVILASEYFIRYFRSSLRPEGVEKNGRIVYPGKGFFDLRLKVLSIALAFNTICLFIRCAFFSLHHGEPDEINPHLKLVPCTAR